MGKIEIIEATTTESIAKTKALFQEYAESLGFKLCFQNFDQELDDFPGTYAAPTGRLFLAAAQNQFIGCVGLRYFEKSVCEMKRLYVRPAFRGQQAGRKLAAAAIQAAQTIGYQAMRLDTLLSMKSANRLYESLGFQQIAPYRHNPIEGAHYMELDLREPLPGP